MKQKAYGTMSIGKLLRNAANRFQDKEALYCTSTGRRFSYRELNERTNRLTNGLMNMGLKKGDIVAILSTNRAEIVEYYFALAKSGIIGLPLN
ncbi:MAG: acyl--CoA ligase [Deltaproteobacteria bacterium]|nr:acyl--CoA ligase [Deltaproteobacteria bacterium]